MATAKEIEEIIGIPARTIETWSRGRDDKYILAKLLKSYSKFDLSLRIERILNEDGFAKKSLGEISISIASDPYGAGIIDSNEKFYIRKAGYLDILTLDSLPNYKPFQSSSLDYLDKRISPALIIEMIEESLTKEGKPLKRILIVNFVSLLPSKNNLIAMYNKYSNYMIEIFSKDGTTGEEYTYSVELILITKSKKPKFLLENSELSEKIKIFDFDEIAKNLYDEKVIPI